MGPTISPVVCITQARMTSTRLPGKVMMEIAGKPLLHYHVERLKMSKRIDTIVVATTVNESDDPIVDYCEQHGYATYRGSEQDVLSRYYECARKFGAKTIIRVTTDCPLIDPRLIDQVIERYQSTGAVYTHLNKDFFVSGFDTEIFSFDALETAHQEASKPQDREHVTPFIVRDPLRFPGETICSETKNTDLDFSVDTHVDFDRLRHTIEALKTLEKRGGPTVIDARWHDITNRRYSMRFIER